MLTALTSSAVLCLCLNAPTPRRWLVRRSREWQAKRYGASAYHRRLRRARKPPDKPGRHRPPKPVHPRGQFRGTSARRPRHGRRSR
eukprot:5694122-Prymnesium_polylepis.1